MCSIYLSDFSTRRNIRALFAAASVSKKTNSSTGQTYSSRTSDYRDETCGTFELSGIRQPRNDRFDRSLPVCLNFSSPMLNTVNENTQASNSVLAVESEKMKSEPCRAADNAKGAKEIANIRKRRSSKGTSTSKVKKNSASSKDGGTNVQTSIQSFFLNKKT